MPGGGWCRFVDREMLKGDPPLDLVVLDASQRTQNAGVAITGHAQIGGREAVGMNLGVLHEDLGVVVIHGVITRGIEATLRIPTNTLGNSLDIVRHAVGEPGGHLRR